jgi:hypothetical protein
MASAKTRYLNVLLHRRRGVFDLGAMTFVSAHIQANIMTGFAPPRKAVLAGRLL